MAKNSILPPNLFLRLFAGLCLIAQAVRPQSVEKTITPCELEAVVRDLFAPNEGYEMHAASLRNQLRNILENHNENYQTLDDENDLTEEDKRSISSLARDGYYLNGKRNIGALARSGLLRASSADDIKRSIATLAKNGQLPSREPDAEVAASSTRWMDEKRNVGSLARSGYLSGKRNIAALVRGGMLPTHSPKRSMSSLARSNSLPYSGYSAYKRNIGAMARDWALPNQQTKMNDYPSEKDTEKRNIGSLKNSQSSNNNGRKKREISFNDFEFGPGNSEIPEPVYQTSPFDYEELIDSLNEEYPLNMHADEKRFLGSVARNGWFRYRPTMDKRHVGSLARSGLLHSSDSSAYRQHRSSNFDSDDNEVMDKRHIGALARSGWLPSFRPVRGGRFSRSGRARSRTVGFYHPQDRHLQPIIAGVCRRCDSTYTNSISWGAPGLQSHWGTPPRLTALHWRNFRGPSTGNNF